MGCARKTSLLMLFILACICRMGDDARLNAAISNKTPAGESSPDFAHNVSLFSVGISAPHPASGMLRKSAQVAPASR